MARHVVQCGGRRQRERAEEKRGAEGTEEGKEDKIGFAKLWRPEAGRGRDGRAKSTRGRDGRGNREMGKSRPGSATFGTTWSGMCGDVVRRQQSGSVHLVLGTVRYWLLSMG